MINLSRKSDGWRQALNCALAVCLFLAVSNSASAQRQVHGVSAELTLGQKIFLPGEDMNAQLRIINRSGQTLALGNTDDWVTFSIRGANERSAPALGDMPTANPFTLASGFVATRAFNPAPYFDVRQPGRYTLHAVIHIPQWHESLECKPIPFTVVDGVSIVGIQPIEFGVAPASGPTNALPETRRYSLARVTYENDEMRLYVRLSDSAGHTIRCYPAGRMLSFGSPEVKMDRFNNLHLLWQTAAKDFSYEVFMPNGDLLLRETHVYTDTRPRLGTNQNGNIMVEGGIRRYSAQDIPTPVSESARK